MSLLAPARIAAARSEVGPIVRLAVPVILGLAASTMLGVTDTIMIAPLGTVPLAAASLVGSVIIVYYACMWGLFSVVGVDIANAHGAGDPRRIAAATRNGIVTGALVGAAAAATMLALLLAVPAMGQPPEVVAILTPYWVLMALLLIPFAILLVFKQLFDAIDRPWVGVGFALVAVLVNVPLNAVLIYGLFGLPALGLTGAGVASLVAETVGAALAWLVWRRARFTRRMRVRAPITRAKVAGAAAAGAPLSVAAMGEAGAYALAGLMLGWFGAAALAANQIVNAVGTVLYMLPLGMSTAVSIRIGQAAGAGETERLRPIALAAIGLVACWALGAAILLSLVGGAIAGALSADVEVIAIATAMFTVVALMQVVDGIQSTALGALRGLMDTTFPSVFSILAYWGFALPASYVAAFVLGLGPPGVWLGFAAGVSVAAVVLPWRFVRLTRRHA